MVDNEMNKILLWRLSNGIVFAHLHEKLSDMDCARFEDLSFAIVAFIYEQISLFGTFNDGGFSEAKPQINDVPFCPRIYQEIWANSVNNYIVSFNCTKPMCCYFIFLISL